MSKVRSAVRRRRRRRPGPWEQRERGRTERVSPGGPAGLTEGPGTALASLRQRCRAREGPWARGGSGGAERPPPGGRLGPAQAPLDLPKPAWSTSLVGNLNEVAGAVALFEEKGRKNTLLQRCLVHSRIRC